MTTTETAAQPAITQQQELIDTLARMAFRVMAVLSKLAAENDLSLTQLRMLGSPRSAPQDQRAGLCARTGQVDGLRSRRPHRETGPS